MKQVFSNWSKRSLSIEHLKLDINNPRFSYQSTKKLNQTEIVKFLIERYEVYELAKDVAMNGYMLGEEPIVCKEDDAFVVLEGNRRMAACKILLNPHKYLSKIKAQTILAYEFSLEKIDCHISPSRKDANFLIYRKHNGVPIKRWDKVNQDTFLHNLVTLEQIKIEEISKSLGITASEIRKSLRRYYSHQYAIKLFSESSSIIDKIAQEDFPITSFERFYESEDGADFLGITFTSTGKIKRRIPAKEFDDRFKYIITDILNDVLNSRTFNAESDRERYFNRIKSDYDLKPTLTEIQEPVSFPDIDDSEDEPDDKPTPSLSDSKPNNGKSKVEKFFGDVEWLTGINRIDSLFDSLQKIRYRRNIDMVSVSFRCYLDMIISQYLTVTDHIKKVASIENEKINLQNDGYYKTAKNYITSTYAVSEEEINDDELKKKMRLFEKRDTNFTPSLNKMLSYIASNPSLLDNAQQREALSHLLKNDAGLINLSDFNLLVHNQHYNITSEQLTVTVKNLLPLLTHINDKLKNEQ